MNNEITFSLFDYQAQDGGILDCWLDVHGSDWMYVTGYESWYFWTGTHWQKDESQKVYKQVQDLIDAMNQAARSELASLQPADEGDKEAEAAYDQEAKQLLAYINATKRTSSRVCSVVTMAQAQRATAANDLDAGNVLNLRNGTLDLNTIELRPHSKDDKLTYLLDYEYDPDVLAPRWGQFLQEVLVYDPESINPETQKPYGEWSTDYELCYLFQAMMGYSLTNDTTQEVMAWLSGEGGNGKTIALSIIQKLLGVMTCSVDFQTMGLPGDYSLADIQGKRVIFSTESEKGGKASESWIKRIVSGERISARAIYGKPFEFKSQCKVWWAMNDKPIIKDTGNAIWRRLKLIPFNRTFTEQDKDPQLLEKLEGELSGILNFALDGLRWLRAEGKGKMPTPTSVQQAVDDYKAESNPVAQWVNERTVKTDTPITLQSILYENYCHWCNQNGRQVLNSSNFSRELKRLKVANKRSNQGAVYAVHC